jgi:hypothetical protein
MPFELDQLTMVLSILVGSGLAFQIPEEPEDRYQLVHDYLVRYVRDVQTPGLMAELEAARAAAKTLKKVERDNRLKSFTELTGSMLTAEEILRIPRQQLERLRELVTKTIGMLAALWIAALITPIAMIFMMRIREALLQNAI